MKLCKSISIVLLLVLLGVLGFVVHRNYHARSGAHPIEAVGGRLLSLQLPWGGQHFMQGDGRWSDAKLGDWEYFYFEDLAKIESGKIASCVNGHEGVKDRDHVFKRWAEAR